MKSLGKTRVYASLGLRRGIPELLWAFRKKYTLEEFPVYLDDHPFQILDRIKQETKCGMDTADVVLLPHYMALRMKGEGLLSTYSPKGIGSLPENFHDFDRKWFALGVTFMSMAYNSDRIEPGELPNNLEELVSDKWKNKLGMQSLISSSVGNLGAQFIGSIRRISGEERWANFLIRLKSMNVKTFDCIDHLIQGLVDNRIDIALTVYSLAYFREKMANSPVKSFEIPDVPRMLTFTSAALTKWGKDNDSAKNFLDFLLSSAAQQIVGTIPGISPSRPRIKASYDFEASYSARSEFHPDRLDIRELPEIIEAFKNMGLP